MRAQYKLSAIENRVASQKLGERIPTEKRRKRVQKLVTEAGKARRNAKPKRVEFPDGLRALGGTNCVAGVDLSEASLEKACTEMAARASGISSAEMGARYADALARSIAQSGDPYGAYTRTTYGTAREILDEAAKRKSTKLPRTYPKRPGSHISRHNDYMGRAWTDRAKLIAEMAEAMLGVDYDGFVVTGVSGLLVAPEFSAVTGKPFAFVRKRGDDSHSRCAFEGTLGRRWVFVDDFVSSGKTFRRVCQAIRSETDDFDTVFVGVLQYTSAGAPPYFMAVQSMWANQCWNGVDMEASEIPGFVLPEAHPQKTGPC